MDKEKRRETNRRYYRTHRDKRLDYSLRYRTAGCVSYVKMRFSATKKKCEKKGRIFNLTLEKWSSLMDGVCHYCGSEGGGVDRIDSNKGYEVGNVVPCCGICNRMKLNHSTDFFYNHIEKILKLRRQHEIHNSQSNKT